MLFFGKHLENYYILNRRSSTSNLYHVFRMFSLIQYMRLGRAHFTSLSLSLIYKIGSYLPLSFSIRHIAKITACACTLLPFPQTGGYCALHQSNPNCELLHSSASLTTLATVMQCDTPLKAYLGGLPNRRLQLGVALPNSLKKAFNQRTLKS